MVFVPLIWGEQKIENSALLITWCEGAANCSNSMLYNPSHVIILSLCSGRGIRNVPNKFHSQMHRPVWELSTSHPNKNRRACLHRRCLMLTYGYFTRNIFLESEAGKTRIIPMTPWHPWHRLVSWVSCTSGFRYPMTPAWHHDDTILVRIASSYCQTNQPLLWSRHVKVPKIAQTRCCRSYNPSHVIILSLCSGRGIRLFASSRGIAGIAHDDDVRNDTLNTCCQPRANEDPLSRSNEALNDHHNESLAVMGSWIARWRVYPRAALQPSHVSK